VGGLTPVSGRGICVLLRLMDSRKRAFPDSSCTRHTSNLVPMELPCDFTGPREARSLLDKVRKKWRSKIRGLKDQIMQTQNGPVNLHAQQMSLDAEEAIECRCCR